MQNVIRINKATFYAYHGVFKHEQNIGGKFEADVEIYTDFSRAEEIDNLKQTIDYESVYNIIAHLAMSQKFYLIESLALKIVHKIFGEFANAKKVNVKVRKNNPPIGGVVDSVEVEVSQAREEFERGKN